MSRELEAFGGSLGGIEVDYEGEDLHLRDFVRGLEHGRGHSEANLLHILEKSTPLKRVLPRRIYQYRFRPARNKADANKLEEGLIKRYVKRFGEVPPLNSAIPNRYQEQSW